MLEHVFIDLDNTILDFYTAEEAVLGKALAAHGIAPTPQALSAYQRINFAQWALLEQGGVSIDEVGERRFALLVDELGAHADARALSRTYEQLLASACHFMPGAEALLETLSGRYHLYLVTNGMASVQYARIAHAGIAPYFDKLFVSSDLGAVKPHRAFFDACFAQIEGFAPARAVILGDGLGSDICGGIQAGIHTIWYNPRGLANTSPWQPDAEVRALDRVPALLEKNFAGNVDLL